MKRLTTLGVSLADGFFEIRVSALRKLFPTFLRGRSGIGLMLLRIAIGAVAILQGRSCLLQFQLSAANLTEGVLSAIAGLLICLGALTPFAAGAVSLGAAAIRLSFIPACGKAPLENESAVILVIAASVSLLLIGPGAYSIDAFFLGPREIVIHSNSRLPPRGRH